MKKVLHLTLYLDIGGLERMVWALCRGQKERGWQPSVFVYERNTGELLPQFQELGIPVTFCAKGKGFSIKLLFRILSHLRENEIDFIHSHDLGALIYASLVRLLSGGKIRVVHTQHTFHHLKSRKAVLYEKIFPWLAERLVCVAEDLRRTYLRLGQPLPRLRVVPNGVDFSVLPVSAMEKAQARKHLIALHSLAPEIAELKWIITLGRLASVKGPQHVLSAWNQVRKEEAQRAALLMVGPEGEKGIRERLRASAQNEVHFPGPSLDPLIWLKAADLFVSGSEFEGLPMAGLEAVASRLPMLLSDIPGHALFEGWASFFPLWDPRAGASQMERFLESGKLGSPTKSAEVRNRLESACGADRMTDRYLRIYQELGIGGV